MIPAEARAVSLVNEAKKSPALAAGERLPIQLHDAPAGLAAKECIDDTTCQPSIGKPLKCRADQLFHDVTLALSPACSRMGTGSWSSRCLSPFLRDP